MIYSKVRGVFMYFDYAATTPMTPQTKIKLMQALNQPYGNYNSLHPLGKTTAKIIAESVTQIKKALRLEPEQEIIFTSGATEANNLVFKSLYQQSGKNHVIISPFEHPSILTTVSALQKQGLKVSIAPIDKEGRIIIEKLLSSITEQTFLISFVSCESEMGICQDIIKISQAIKKHHPNIVIHSDMTQSIHKLDHDYGALDFVSFSGHKLGSLVGIGGLISLSNKTLLPQIHGGKSYHPSRAGTVPYEAILSLRFALEEQTQPLSEQFIKSLENTPGILLNRFDHCSPYILNISVLKHQRQASQALLAQHNICVSLGSACSRQAQSRNVALVFNEQRAKNALRISFGAHKQKEYHLLKQYLKELAR